ncbi:MAG TPA: endolytic transglycosylase MltG [Pedococcus sp.]|nr:endolytic transglycosylase MltG [Pedococcus sp.]
MTEPHLEHSIFGAEEHEGRAARRRAARRPRRRRGRRLIVLVLALAIVGGAVYAAYGVLRPVVAELTASNDFPGPGAGEVQVTVNAGDTGRAIGVTLQKAGVVKTSKAFMEVATADSRAASIQPGTYTLRKQMAAQDALAILVNPKNRTVPRVTVPEGLWATEVFAALSEATKIPVKEYQAAAKDPSALGLPASAKGNLEGYLFPATYEFPAKSTAREQLTTMVKKSVDELAKAGVSEDQMERTMIVASIVEGEVSGDADRAKVARVIENRLAAKDGPTRGLLQMDSTVHYAVKKRGKAGTTDADRASASPYNTYRVQGLPPGPINNPGAASIAAAANPAEGPWLFFVTVNPSTGETRFASTVAEHQGNVNLFNQWCRDNAGKC